MKKKEKKTIVDGPFHHHLTHSLHKNTGRHTYSHLHRQTRLLLQVLKIKAAALSWRGSNSSAAAVFGWLDCKCLDS